jgi:serine/threonine protein kinase
MGAVYEAVHERLGKTVALKILPAPKTVHPEYHARFEREAKLVGRLDHINVVQATDAGSADGVPYLAMELVDGVDVAKLVRELGPLSVADAAEIGRQAAAGLAHAHGRGVIHRDIKPSNLMITSDGTVKVLDLGLALCADAVTGGGIQLTGATYLGTQDYMSPEQWDDPSLVDAKADVYALGCVIHQMLIGHAPFAAVKTSSLKLKAHRNQAPADLTQRSDVPPLFAALVQRMLAKYPVERPYVAEVQVELAAFAVGSNLPRLVERGRLVTAEHYDDGEPTQAMPKSMKPVPTIQMAPVKPSRAASLVLWAMVMTMFAASFVVGLILIFRHKFTP